MIGTIQRHNAALKAAQVNLWDTVEDKRKRDQAGQIRAKMRRDEHTLAEGREERGREASQPYHQFLARVALERDRRLHQAGYGTALARLTDINTAAYKRAKETWTDWGVWNPKWGVLPGLAWQHELHIEEFLHELLGDEPVDGDLVWPGCSSLRSRSLSSFPSASRHTLNHHCLLRAYSTTCRLSTLSGRNPYQQHSLLPRAR